MGNRPELTKHISLKDFNDFYWLKKELVIFCRSENLNNTDSKIEITKRIEYYLRTGKKLKAKIKPKPKSTFDWNTESLALNTIITDNYINSENVRCFFKKNLGQKFKFNVKFMNWMKTSVGKTLGDAINQWEVIIAISKSNIEPKIIAPQFEYNNYIRDFLKDNPEKSKIQATKYWKIKKSLRGNNSYIKTDLELL